jgi:RTX calcium-binding nonapeptide repeat (4 copies)
MSRSPLVPVAAVLAIAAAIAVAGCGASGLGADSLFGTGGDDQLKGTEGADFLFGGAAEDSIEGGGGDDVIVGGLDADFLYGGAGDDRFVAGEDDAVDVHECGDGKDVVVKPDTRDELQPDCEEAGWTAQPLDSDAFENRMTVQPRLAGGTATFQGSCPDEACDGQLELRTPHDRLLLGKARFAFPKGQSGDVSVRLNRDGRELVGRGGYVRVVIRSRGVDSGFTTFIGG